jgi:predicted HTH transcriptional regulator
MKLQFNPNLDYQKQAIAAISYQGIQRIERFPVPYEALRETVLNALVHRDYAEKNNDVILYAE